MEMTPLRREHRASRPYVANRGVVSFSALGSSIEPMMRSVGEFLATHETPPAGPPFLRFLHIEMPDRLTFEVGFPVAKPIAVDDEALVRGFVPSGDYAVCEHVGPPESMVQANAEFQRQADAQGIVLACRRKEGKESWSGRFEHLLTDPADEADSSKWVTQLAYLLA